MTPVPQAADDVLVGGLLEECRLALELLLRLGIREGHDLDRVVSCPTLGSDAEHEPLSSLPQL